MTTSTNVPKHVEEALEKFERNHLPPELAEERRHAGGELRRGGQRPARPVSQSASRRCTAGPYHDPDFHQLDSWIVVHEDNTATFYVGKTDCGQGTGTGFRQLMSDELDIAYDKTTCIMGSTDITVDQGGSGGSTAMERDAWPMRRAAAEARRVLLEMGSTRLGVPADRLAVSAGVITVKADPSRRVTYGELVGGKRFNVTLTGNNVNAATGVAQVKPVTELQVHRPVSAALRHSSQSRWFAEMGRGRQASGHGACAQRKASVRGREAASASTSLPCEACRDSSRW